MTKSQIHTVILVTNGLKFDTLRKELETYLIRPKSMIEDFYQNHVKTFSRLTQAAEIFLFIRAYYVKDYFLMSHFRFKIFK
jgi:hypothetical protein